MVQWHQPRISAQIARLEPHAVVRYAAAAACSTTTGFAVNVAPRQTTAFGPSVTISLFRQPIVVRYSTTASDPVHALRTPTDRLPE